MFNKCEFANIIKKIKETYNTQEEFAKKSGIGRTYLSQYMNKKLEKPPKPDILKKLSDASNGMFSYYELMSVCDYIHTSDLFSDEINPALVNAFKETFMKYGISLEDINAIEEISKNKIGEKRDKEIALILSKYDSSIIEKVFYTLQTNRQNLSTEAELSKPMKNSTQFYMCPVYGHISAGQPNWAEECVEGRIPIEPEIMNIVEPEQCFFLRVSGESMNKLVKNGGYALIRKQNFVEDGEIAVVLVNGYNATLKKFTRQGDFVILEPMSYITDDPNIKTQIYDKNTSIRILGKYIGKFEIN